MDSEESGHSESEIYHSEKEAFNQTTSCFLHINYILVSCFIFPIWKEEFQEKINASYLVLVGFFVGKNLFPRPLN